MPYHRHPLDSTFLMTRSALLLPSAFEPPYPWTTFVPYVAPWQMVVDSMHLAAPKALGDTCVTA